MPLELDSTLKKQLHEALAEDTLKLRIRFNAGMKEFLRRKGMMEVWWKSDIPQDNLIHIRKDLDTTVWVDAGKLRVHTLDDNNEPEDYVIPRDLITRVLFVRKISLSPMSKRHTKPEVESWDNFYTRRKEKREKRI